MNPFARWVFGLAIAAAVFFWATPPALAQKTTLPGAVTRVRGEPPVIVSQLQMAVSLARRALSGFEGAGEETPLDAPHQTASNVYVLIRAARAGMEEYRAPRTKFPDPLFDLAYSRITTAWNRARAPVDRFYDGGPRTAYAEASIRNLNEAIRLIEQALLLWP